MSRSFFSDYVHSIVLFYVPYSHQLPLNNWWVAFTYCFICAVKYNWWVGYYILSCEYYGWPVHSWFFQFEGFSIMNVEEICADVLDLWVSSVESLGFSILSFLGLLAALKPFQHMSVVWLFLWQCGQEVSFTPCQSCSLRMHFRLSLMAFSGFLK